MENLTRERAIEEHRKLWNWIADEQEKHPIRIIYKDDYFIAHPEYLERPISFCWCCEYAVRANINVGQIHPCTTFCPIYWGGGRCDTDNSLYKQWYKTLNMKKRAELARQIANLPERTVDQNEK